MTTIIERIRNNDADLKELSLIQSPHEYNFDDASSTELFDALAANKKIESVRIGDAFVRGLSSSVLCRNLICSVAKLTSVKRVHIDGGRIKINYLGELMEYARGLTVLDLKRVELVGKEADFTKFQVSFFRHRSLQEFTMKDFTLSGTDHGFIDEVMKVLALIPTLTAVKLQAKKTDQEQARLDGSSLSSLLTRSGSLEHLHISQYSIDPKGIKRVAKGVRARTSLKVLSLSCVGLDDAGAAALAAELPGLRNLEVLDLSSNSIGDEGCVALADGLQRNDAVRTVRLTGNKRIGNDGHSAMARMLQQNGAIANLEMPAIVGGSSAFSGDIRDGLSHNRTSATAA